MGWELIPSAQGSFRSNNGTPLPLIDEPRVLSIELRGQRLEYKDIPSVVRRCEAEATHENRASDLPLQRWLFLHNSPLH